MPLITRRRPHLRTSFRLLLGFTAAAALAGCQTPIDLTRVSGFTGTLGEEIHEIFCKRFASEAYPNDVSGMLSKDLCEGLAQPTADTPPRLAGIADERSRLATALDAMMPQDTHTDLYDLLHDILPLYDDGTLPGQTRGLNSVFLAISNDAQAPNTYARISHHQGYRPMQYGFGVTRAAFGYPKLRDVLLETLGALDEGGVANGAFHEVLRANALELATMGPTAAANLPSNATLTRQLLFTQDPLFTSGTPHLGVLRDLRGVALPAGVNGTTVPAPYVDTDGDHLPDVDTLDRYVDASGAPLVVPTPFEIENEQGVTRDAQGRALVGGTPAYQYHDLDQTMAAGLVRELASWVKPSTPTLVDVARSLPVLLGTASDRTRTYGSTTLTYPGFDPATGATYDLLHGTLSILPRQETVDGLVLLQDLLTNHEAPVADLIQTGLYGDLRADAHPEAVLTQPNIFWDEMLASIERMGQAPGLLEGVTRSLDDDRSQDLDEVIALFARNKDAISIAQSVNPGTWNAAIPAGAVSTPVNRAATDADPTNESLLQRSVYLINDLNGVKYCNKDGAQLILHTNWSDTLYADGTGTNVNETLYSNVILAAIARAIGLPRSWAACDLIQIDNVAEAYTQTIWGGYKFELKGTTGVLLQALQALGLGSLSDTLLENTTQIRGMGTYPTPQAMARFVFAAHNNSIRALVNDLQGRDGAVIEDRHCLGRAAGDRTTPCPNAVIFAWEKPITLRDGHTRTFLDALRPMLQSLDTNQPAGSFFFGDISTALHRHWPSRSATRTQRTNPAAAGFSYQDNIRSYEPLLAEIFDTGLLLHRVRATVQAADGFTVRAGVDGVHALASLLEVLVDPNKSCVGSCTTGSLKYRNGRSYITYNDGTKFDGTGGRPRRYPSPLYLLLDALHTADDAWATDDARHQTWLGARSRIVDQFFTTEVVGGDRRLKNRRAYAMLRATVPFLRGRVEAHRTGATPDTTARAWAAARETGISESLSGPVPASMMRLMDALNQDTPARDAFLGLLSQLLDESVNREGVTGMIYALSDLLQILDDDAHMVRLLNVLSVALAENAQTVVASGGTVDETTSVSVKSIGVFERIAAADTTSALPRVLAHSVELPTTGAPVTNLETVMDVIAEVNRTTPVVGGPTDDQDVKDILASIEEFLSNTERGLERLYAVIEHRKVTP